MTARSAPAGPRTRLLVGALAGLAGTAAMTSAMSRLHRRLPPGERYPLPPREIIERLTGPLDQSAGEDRIRDATLATHFAFGAAAGAALSIAFPRPTPASGAAGGLLIWAASYLGGIPAAGVLEPATRHPARRNMLMAGVHLVWGAVSAAVIHELLLSRETMLAPGPLRDAPVERR